MDQMDQIEKIKVGHLYSCPIGHVVHEEIGGYLLTQYEDEGYIIGLSQLNISTYDFQKVSIIPITKKLIEESKTPFSEKMELMDNFIYYVVSYGDYGYIFKDFETAVSLLSFVSKFNEKKIETTFSG